MIGHKLYALADALDGVKWSATKDKFRAICPRPHSTPSRSLWVEAPDDKIILKCWKGCGALDVLTTLGLDWGALFPDRPKDNRIRRSPPIPYREALVGIDFEAAVVAIVAGRLEQGIALTTADLDRLALAAQRIDAARRITRAQI